MSGVIWGLKRQLRAKTSFRHSPGSGSEEAPNPAVEQNCQGQDV